MNRRLRGLALIAVAIVVVAIGAWRYMNPRAFGPKRTDGAIAALVRPTPGPLADYRALFALDMRHLWEGEAKGDGGYLYRSDDGGATWHGAEIPFQALEVKFFDPTHGVATGASFGAGIYETSDGGVTWSPINLLAGTVSQASEWVSPSDGWAQSARGGLWATNDGGRSWRSLAATPGQTDFFDLVFRDPLHGVVQPLLITHLQNGVSAEECAQPTLYYTDDGGATWRSPKVPPTFKSSSGFFIQWLGDGTGAVTSLGGTCTPGQPSTQTLMSVTYDGGMTWSPTLATSSGLMDMVSATEWWVTAGNALERTFDGGSSFLPVAQPRVALTLMGFKAFPGGGVLALFGKLTGPGTISAPSTMATSTDYGGHWTVRSLPAA